jgi:ribosomal protein L20A (L18A)
MTEISLYDLINESTKDQEILFWLDIEINWKITTLQYYCGPKFNGYRIMIDNNLCFMTDNQKYYVAIDKLYSIIGIYDSSRNEVRIREINYLQIEKEVCELNIKDLKIKIDYVLNNLYVSNKFLLLILQYKKEKYEFRLQKLTADVSILLSHWIKRNI